MSKAFKELKRQRHRDAASERDAIRSANKAKGFIYGRDSVSNDDESDKDIPPEQILPNATKGKDSTEPQARPPAAPPPVVEPTSPDQIVVTAAQLDSLGEMAYNKAKAELAGEIKALKDAAEELERKRNEDLDRAEREKEELERKLETKDAQQKSLHNVFAKFGYTPPGQGGGDSTIPTTSYIASDNLRGGIRASDAYREVDRMLKSSDDCPVYQVHNTLTGAIAYQKDMRNVQRFILENRDAVRRGIEERVRRDGLLRGSNVSLVRGGRDAPTTLADVDPAFQTYLSTIVRLEHSAKFVLWQFPNRSVSVGVPPGQTTAVPRVPHIDAGTVTSDWSLTPGTARIADSQPITATAENVVINEYGMGKDAVVRPVGIPEFIYANSLIELESVVRDRIGYNYHRFEDLSIFETLIATTAVRYNSNNSVVAAPANVAGGGQLTVGFLGSLFAHMAMLQIPTYSDGCYVIVCTPGQVAQLAADMQANHQYLNKSQTESLTSMLFSATNNDAINATRVRGYVGTIAGMHVFQQSSYALGAAGTPGVQNETLGTTASDTRVAFAMGADATAWSTSMPMEIRELNSRDKDRLHEFVWISHESGCAALDVDPLANPGVTDNQQLRVLAVHLSDIAV